MKTYTLAMALLITLFAGACKKDNATTITTIKGKWKLVGNYMSNGSAMFYTPVPVKADYDYVQFNNDGSVAGTAFNGYTTYTLKDSVNVTLTKNDKTTSQNYYYTIRHDTLQMSPNGPIRCIEGCSTVFVWAGK